MKYELFSAGGEDQAFANKGPDTFVIRRPSDAGVYEPYFLKDFIKVKLFFWVSRSQNKAPARGGLRSLLQIIPLGCWGGREVYMGHG